MAIDTNYFLQKGESNEAYNARVAAYNASKNSSAQASGSDAFIETLQNKLLGQADMISSSSTNLESKINEAIGGVQKAGEASRAALESSSNREIAFQKEQFGQQRTGVLESQRGFAINQAALIQLDQRTEKSLRDMEQRKQELILQGDAVTASKISELQLQSIQFKQQAEQQAFSNIFNLGQLELTKMAEQRAADQFKQSINFQKEQLNFSQQSKMAELALQYGVSVLPGDTLQSVAKRAQPFASAEQKARIAKLLKDTQEEQTTVNLDGLLYDSILSGQTPEMAAITATNYMNSIGVKPTKKDLAGFIEKATTLKSSYQIEKDKVAAEESGKSFWNTLSGLTSKVYGKIESFYGIPGTPEERGKFRQLDKKFRSNQEMTEQEKEEYYDLLRSLQIVS